MGSEAEEVDTALPAGNQDSVTGEVPAGNDDETSHAEASNTVGTEEDSHVDDEQSTETAPDTLEDDGEEKEKPTGESVQAEEKTGDSPATPGKKKRRVMPPSSRRGRAPAVKGLTIPFRTVKKAMKLDPDIPIVQNEAAICVTLAAELFLKSLARESQQIAKNRGRNTIRYEDVAEARCDKASLAFLQSLLP